MFHTFEMLPPRLCDFPSRAEVRDFGVFPLLGRRFGTMTRLEFREVHGTPTVEAAHRPGTTVSNSSSN